MAKVFDPIMVGQMEVKNRLWTAPLVCNHATEEGHVTPKLIANYHERAKGGWGLVQVEATYVRKDGNMFARMLGFYTTHQITGMNELACAIRNYLEFIGKDREILKKLSFDGLVSDLKDVFSK